MDWTSAAKNIILSIPEQYRTARISDFPGVAGLKSNEQDWDSFGYCLRGKPGIGKTHLACALAISLLHPAHPETLARKNVEEWETYASDSIRFVSTPELICRLRSTFRDGAKESEYDIVTEYKRCKVLILDDLGAEKRSDYSASSLYAIISGRRNAHLFTIVTTNQTLNEINEWEPRIASRLGEYTTIKLEGNDRRLAR